MGPRWAHGGPTDFPWAHQDVLQRMRTSVALIASTYKRFKDNAYEREREINRGEDEENDIERMVATRRKCGKLE